MALSLSLFNYIPLLILACARAVANSTPPHFAPTQCRNAGLFAFSPLCSNAHSSTFTLGKRSPSLLFRSLAVPCSKPNPKRAERHPHYHSCSRQRKVCFRPGVHPLSLPSPPSRRASVRIPDSSQPGSRSIEARLHPAVMLYEFRALYTLISAVGIVSYAGRNRYNSVRVAYYPLYATRNPRTSGIDSTSRGLSWNGIVIKPSSIVKSCRAEQ